VGVIYHFGGRISYLTITNATYQEIISTLMAGIKLTIMVTLVAFSFSIILGLLTAFGQMSKNTLIKNLATLYVQIVRGIPVIVLIFYTALVIVPAGINLLNALGDWLVSLGVLPPDNFLTSLTSRNVDFVVRIIAWRSITAHSHGDLPRWYSIHRERPVRSLQGADQLVPNHAAGYPATSLPAHPAPGQ
jgi:His/Glu/Gln/Arg/opine family amino acid ABC transporter permease subunit